LSGFGPLPGFAPLPNSGPVPGLAPLPNFGPLPGFGPCGVPGLELPGLVGATVGTTAAVSVPVVTGVEGVLTGWEDPFRRPRPSPESPRRDAPRRELPRRRSRAPLGDPERAAARARAADSRARAVLATAACSTAVGLRFDAWRPAAPGATRTIALPSVGAW
jgi:hypothetical protein